MVQPEVSLKLNFTKMFLQEKKSEEENKYPLNEEKIIIDFSRKIIRYFFLYSLICFIYLFVYYNCTRKNISRVNFVKGYCKYEIRFRALHFSIV